MLKTHTKTIPLDTFCVILSLNLFFFFLFFCCVLSVSRGSCGDLVDETSSGVSPSLSNTSMPSCLHFPWFGERGRERAREKGRGEEREKLRSVSSSSLPYMTTAGRDHVSGDVR